MKRLVYFYFILILSGIAILSMGCTGGITTPGTGGGTGSAYTSYPMDISYAKNYIFPTDYGVMIVTDIPDGVDKINYYDISTDTLIGSSSQDKEIIKYNTTDDEVRIKLVPVINGEEKEEYALISKVKRNQSEGIIYNLRFDPRDYEHLSITLVIKDEEAYNELFQDYNGQKIGKIQNEIEDIVELDSTESNLPIAFHKENIEPEGIHIVYYITPSKGQFPLYIGYIPKMYYINETTGVHSGAEFTYADNDYLVAHIPSIFFYYNYGDPTYSRVNLSYPDEWKAIITYFNKGTFPEHSSDYTTYLMHTTPTDDGLAIGDITLNAYTVTNNYTLYIGWFKFLQGSIDLSLIDKIKWMYKYFIEKIGMPEFDHRTIIATPSPSHGGGSWCHPWNEGTLYVDVHGTIRLWLGGSEKFHTDGGAFWFDGAGITDSLLYMKYKVLNLDPSEYESGWDSDDSTLPGFIENYINEVRGNPDRELPLSKFWDVSFILSKDDYIPYRMFRIRLATIVLDMLVHSTSGGRVTDLLEVVGRLFGSPQPITNDDIFDAIADFTDYDFKPFIDAYIYGTKPINADVKEKNGIYVTAISDYTTGKMIHIDTLTNNSATITGHADKDTFVTITCNKGLKNITVNDAQPSQTYTPWETEKAKAVSVPKGDYVINVSW